MDNLQNKEKSKASNVKEEISIDFIQILLILKRFIVVIIAAALLFGLVGFLYTRYYVEPVYRSNCQVLINAGTGSASQEPGEGYISPGSMQTSQKFALALSIVARSKSFLTPILETLKEEGYSLPKGASYETLNSMINITVGEDVQVLDISVDSTDRRLAQRLMELIYEKLPEEANNAIPGASIWPLLKPPTSGEMEDVKRVSPNILTNTLIAAVIGIVLCSFIVVLISVFDRRVKNAVDIENMLGVPVVGRIPDQRK